MQLIMMSEIIIGNGDGSRTHDRVHKPIRAIRQRIMIDPNMTRSKYRNSITVRHCPPPIMRRRASHQSIPGRSTVMYMQPMNNNIRNKLDRKTSPIRDMNVNSSSINCLETIHNKFLFQLNDHVAFEHNPEWRVLDDSVAQSARSGVDRVIVG